MKQKQELGFTLIELLVALSVAAILMLIAIPSFQSLLQSVKLDSTKSSFMTSLNFAMAEASRIVPGTQSATTPVTICKSDTTSANPVCDTATCQGGAGESGVDCWEEGWLVFRDANGNGTLNDGTDPDYCVPSRDCTLRVFPPLATNMTLRSSVKTDLWIVFQSDGTPVGNDGNIVSETFKLCMNTDAANAWSFTIKPAGLARVKKGATSCP